MTTPTRPAVDRRTAAAMYGTMALIRRFEQAAYRGYEQGEVHGTVHVGIGQEAVAVGMIGALRETDSVLSHHRGHAHALAKGVPPERLMAELYGRSDGVSRGKGGSMHATDLRRGFLGTMAIVGSSIPVATGVALANKVRGRDDVCVAFFGDGAVNQGVLYESLNLAALWRLPVIFVCENNSYAITTAVGDATAGPGVAARAEAFGVQAETIDGQDVLAVREAAERMIEGARAGRPALVECLTYRFMGHSRGDPAHGVYRDKEEVELWQRRDPLRVLAEHAGLGDDLAAELTAEARERVRAAVEFAGRSPVPGPAALMEDIVK
ncbi:pyruvate dehydrogenase E1 component subunit alpha [Sphaerisporangium rufum]|uniref:Pyruvate dehydrogenase E1 component subunit alpha n=1 Tax=Sphaerisporangium rufum TaxID=1381558 RepID=A0A919R2J6_9ACTN|nr:thiamine pyrophosphate-dependent dehydrogenase E1 component subunit alpha [Sphaerisporangium rufum]GII78497.1 pyruvate dehydrogenase E1 component subunit alpha [Sphaerisporangium rufum]